MPLVILVPHAFGEQIVNGLEAAVRMIGKAAAGNSTTSLLNSEVDACPWRYQSDTVVTDSTALVIASP
jgi:hypothetical protein